MTLREMQESGWLSGGKLDEAKGLLWKDREEEERLPWIARFSMGLGAWFAGIFTIAFLLTLLETADFEEGIGYFSIGLVFLGVGIAVIRLQKNVFLDQLALVLSFAGYAMASIGIADMWPGYDDFVGPLVLSLVLSPVVYWLSGHAVLKFMAVGWTWLTWFAYSFEDQILWLLLLGLGVALVVVVLILSGQLRMKVWRPALISTLIALFSVMWVMSSEAGGRREPFYAEAYPAIGTIMVLGFSCLLWRLQRGAEMMSTLSIAFYGVVAGLIGFLGSPGVGVALGLLVVAQARRDRWLGWLAVLALTGFLILFYYFLGISLMAKSFSLMGTGAALLVACALIPYVRKSSGKLATGRAV